MVVDWLGVALLTLPDHSRGFEHADKEALSRETQRLTKSFSWIDTTSTSLD